MPTAKKQKQNSKKLSLQKRGSKKDTKKISAKKTPAKKASKRIMARSEEQAHVRLQAMEASEKTSLDTLYIVNGSNNNVSLAVHVGDQGQTSDMSIKLDEKTLASKLAGDFEETPLDTNNNLHGQKLSIIATITDSSRDTNVTSLSLRLKGGFKDQDFELSKTVDTEGASANYLCLIEFFNPGV